MTQEDKELLLKHLCARLPYGVKLHACYKPTGEWADGQLICVEKTDDAISFEVQFYGHIPFYSWCDIEQIKPYLRPMSSMTEEERSNLRAYCRTQEGIIYDIGVAGAINSPAIIDWLNKNMFDYRGLIPMGLALEAPEDMYKTE